MATITEKKQPAVTPYDDPLPASGKGAIVVPLILGGAIIVAVIMLWEAQTHKDRVTATAHVEERVRADLRLAYAELKARNPEAAIVQTTEANEKLASLHTALATDYAELKMASLLIEGEALFIIDSCANAVAAEDRFNRALGLMIHSSGEIWQYGMLGRARAKLEQADFVTAIADLDLLLERNPSFGAAYYWRSLAKKAAGDDAGAGEDARIARNLDSWPPLRDFMQGSRSWTRDILCTNREKAE